MKIEIMNSCEEQIADLRHQLDSLKRGRLSLTKEIQELEVKLFVLENDRKKMKGREQLVRAEITSLIDKNKNQC